MTKDSESFAAQAPCSTKMGTVKEMSIALPAYFNQNREKIKDSL
ncbi:hypothetical protein [Sporosarcina sp.]|nr:hypothetical protein [Sporosarcina sp.]